MDFKESIQRDTETAQRIQERVQFYSLTLTFTLLALSIETFQPCEYKLNSVVELVGWLLLIISGIVGLYRMSLVPDYYQSGIKLASLVWDISDANNIKLNGDKQLYLPKEKEAVDINFYIETKEKSKDAVEAEEIKLAKRLWITLKVHGLFLILGIICLAFSRAYDTIIHVLGT